MTHFNPRTPCGVRHFVKVQFALTNTFQSTHPLRGATSILSSSMPRAFNFNPRTPCGVRHGIVLSARCGRYFNPRTPCGVRLHVFYTYVKGFGISIHAPLAGCDDNEAFRYMAGLHFNPRTPCGVRLCRAPQKTFVTAFQSTHPLRGATSRGSTSPAYCRFQSTHPLRGATCDSCDMCPYYEFQSTHPLRGATAKTYKENCTFFELADKLSARIAAKKPSAKADRCA